MNATYVSATQFTVVGDQTPIFVADRKLKCDCGVDGYKYGAISSSAYTSVTIITMTTEADDLTSNLTSVEWSVQLPVAVPIHVHTNEESGGDLNLDALSLAAVQARRTTAYTLTTSYVDITFDATDVETDSDVVEHNNSNTERIDIKADGTYLIMYGVDIDAPDTLYETTFPEAQVEKNGTTALDGSHSKTTTYNDDSITAPEFVNHLSQSFVTSLSNGDYVTLQMRYSEDQAATNTNMVFIVVKLDGLKGDTGATGAAGADGDITWQGAWSGATAYTTNQAVTHEGTSYVCIQNNTNQEPPNGTYWDVLAEGADATLAAVQARRTTTYTLTGSYVDITFDATDEETDASVLEHNNSNTERIDVKADGTYLIMYGANIQASTTLYDTTFPEAQVEKNGSTALNGSYSKIATF